MLLHNSYIKGSQLEDFNKMCILGSLCDETITFYVGFCLAGRVPGRDPQRNTTQMKVESCCKCTRLETTPHACKMTQCTTLHHMRLSPMKEKKKKKSQHHATLTIRLNQQICVFSVLPLICICCRKCCDFFRHSDICSGSE